MNLYSTRDTGALANANIRQLSAQWVVAVIAFAGFISACVLGCGMAASPQPPSLQLPKPVRDLTAARIGDRVSLHWTTPRETTDKLKIKAPVQVQICRQRSTAPCEPVATIAAAPGKPADYADTLPPALTSGRLNEMTYT